MKPRGWRERIVVVLTGLSLSAVAPSDPDPLAGAGETDITNPSAASGATQPDTNAPPATAVQRATINLPADLAAVVRLAEAGVSEDVIVAYVEKSTALSPLTADQIVYLRDLGISSRVIQALVEHRGTQPVPAAGPAAASPPPDTGTVAPLPPAETDTGVGPPDSGTSDYGYYANALSPYGAWLELPGYGWCWQPAVVLVNPSWQPYCNDGYWLWSDCGWYWKSSYSWGWAPFHHGRWCRHPRYGWVWCPDRVWGPAWVCWRQGPGCCGWAPLPPGARFTADAGWTFKGMPVGQYSAFHMPKSAFTFVSYSYLTDRHPLAHRLPARQVSAIFNQTAVNNNLEIGPNGRVINHGVDPRFVAAVSLTPFRQTTARELEMPAHSARAVPSVPVGSSPRPSSAGISRSPVPSVPAARSSSASPNRP